VLWQGLGWLPPSGSFAAYHNLSPRRGKIELARVTNPSLAGLLSRKQIPLERTGGTNRNSEGEKDVSE
jgi:hypothetical protein